MQNDFVPGGAIPAQGGHEIVPLINRLQSKFDVVVATQDWHPVDHGSFASSNPGRKVGETISLNGLEQVLWPDHAIQESEGAELLAELDRTRIARVFRKGMDPGIDSYSGFFDNDRSFDTGLAAYLRDQGVTHVYVVGLALDWCVKFTALDAIYLTFETTVIVDATRSVGLERTAAIEAMRATGVKVVESTSVLDTR
jgi:nicotinamidase/pyrazinamidase